MEDKKHYFVTIDTKEIREMSIPDSGIEFEIIANQKEKEDIEALFREKDQDSKNATMYLTKPFNEWGADDERSRYDAHMLSLYRKLYELGTKETKEKINELGIFN
ncbi:hypothetical protein JOC34_000963 [Virgibacillus halotolerans]|uniref:hypothetical protein n=1 Tax=Virgibacillus halotolerans TaxID=1071053 RepID=UPI0019617EE8|nr:hypothetical protein [Virgibacillus halotolerans]MBM7598606.1 hypothetical protein [Virgibacillus halotolerans]